MSTYVFKGSVQYNYCIATDSAGNAATSSTVTASMDTSLELLGDCDVCNGDGNCNRCSGSGWVESKDNYVAGDANSDKRVNLADVLMILQYEAGWDVSPDSQTSDTDANHVVDARDALRILLYIDDRGN